jgi:hypothetical protein
MVSKRKPRQILSGFSHFSLPYFFLNWPLALRAGFRLVLSLRLAGFALLRFLVLSLAPSGCQSILPIASASV